MSAGRLALVLPGNTFHSNILPNRWAEMFRTKVGLEAIGASEVPVSVSYQGIDYEVLPWLQETFDRFPSIEVLNAPHGHGLIPLMPKKLQAWEASRRIGTSDCTFFPEFYAPQPQMIPTKYFLVLENASYLYSACAMEDLATDINIQSITETPLAFNCEGKIGIVMDGLKFKNLLDAFFRFQRDPVTVDESSSGKNPLENLLDQVEKIGASGQTVVCPIDIEAPFVGSALGATVWELFFQGVKRRGLEKIFVKLSDTFEEMEEKAVPAPVPERILTKWTSFRVQVNYLIGLAKFQPVDNTLFSIAYCSDILSAFERKIGDGKKPIVLKGRNLANESVNLPISFSQDVIDVQLAAVSALLGKERFSRRLAKLSQTAFVSKMKEFALANRL
jgi:hypothetical protein